MPRETNLTGVERHFADNEIIVSKTDLKGRVTYANRVFLNIAGFSEQEVLNQPHSLIRHPDMPRCVFKLLWDTIQMGKEIFAYVINRSQNGDHYWVYAHVTPSLNNVGDIIGYHSNRRVPNRKIVTEAIIPLYKALCEAEHAHDNRKQGMEASHSMVVDLLAQHNVAYDEFILTL